MTGPARQKAPLADVLAALRSGKSGPEVAAQMGCSVALIYARLREAGLSARDFLKYRPTTSHSGGGIGPRASSATALSHLPTHPEWMEQAACLDAEDPEVFHAGKGDKAGVAAARAICRPCEVKAECLTYALQIDDRHGIWAGTTPKQRSALRKRRAS